jgi:ABC-type amino acid transport system permease subunit
VPLSSCAAYFITPVKDTAPAHVIAIPEFFRVAHGMATTRMSITPYLLVGCFYLPATFFITRLFNHAERRLRRGRFGFYRKWGGGQALRLSR